MPGLMMRGIMAALGARYKDPLLNFPQSVTRPHQQPQQAADRRDHGGEAERYFR